MSDDFKNIRDRIYMPEWVSANDRFPDKNNKYICFVKNRGIRIREFHEWITGSRKRFWCNGSEDKNITHWIKLPEPPSVSKWSSDALSIANGGKGIVKKDA